MKQAERENVKLAQELLKSQGAISIPFLQRRLRVSFKEAQMIKNEIACEPIVKLREDELDQY